MREEYHFAKDFLDEIASSKKIHPFLREKGYQAIAGDNQLNADEIEYLLSLKELERALRDFVLGRPYLEHLPDRGDIKIAFWKKYQRTWSRQWRRCLYLTLSIGLVSLVLVPLLILIILSSGATYTFASFVVSAMVFSPYAWLSLKASTRIYRAQELVKHQHKHTQKIVLNSSNPSLKRKVKELDML